MDERLDRYIEPTFVLQLDIACMLQRATADRLVRAPEVCVSSGSQGEHGRQEV